MVPVCTLAPMLLRSVSTRGLPATAHRKPRGKTASRRRARHRRAEARVPAGDASTMQSALKPEPLWPCLWDPRPGLTVPRLEGLDRRVDIRVHRTHRAIRLDYMVLGPIRCAVGKPRAHFVLGRDIVYPNAPGRRRPARAIKARCDVRSDDEDTSTGYWVARVSDGWWRERDHRHACNECGRCANR